jgi:hypothetical protein
MAASESLAASWSGTEIEPLSGDGHSGAERAGGDAREQRVGRRESRARIAPLHRVASRRGELRTNGCVQWNRTTGCQGRKWSIHLEHPSLGRNVGACPLIYGDHAPDRLARSGGPPSSDCAAPPYSFRVTRVGQPGAASIPRPGAAPSHRLKYCHNADMVACNVRRAGDRYADTHARPQTEARPERAGSCDARARGVFLGLVGNVRRILGRLHPVDDAG